MVWAFNAIDLYNGFATLVGEEVNRMGSVVPQQVIGPAAGLSLGIDILATEEIGLHIHLLDIQFTGLDLVMYPLV